MTKEVFLEIPIATYGKPGLDIQLVSVLIQHDQNVEVKLIKRITP